MADVTQQLFNPLKKFWNEIPDNKRWMWMSGLVLILGVTTFVLYLSFKPQYRVLYSDLALEDSAQITEALKSENIPFKLQQEGRRILVQSQVLYQTRLRMASLELPQNRTTGWELFDQSRLGVTDFVQKINYRRGLEGELSRTILQLEPVEAVRVHLVIPEESLFRDRQKETMASVTLKVKRGQRLLSNQVEGITFLVASAVEGLAPNNVTVVDSKGVVLSERLESDPVIRLSSSQMEIQRQVEANLTDKGQSLLDMRFGAGRSALQVTAEMDFRQHEQTREIYDGENPAVRSEELTTSSSMGRDTSSTRTENTITNYELNLTRERIVAPIGQIKRISAAVMVDGKYVENGTVAEGGERTFVPLTPEEINTVENTISTALGINLERGDRINVVSIPFQEIDMIDDSMMMTTNKWENIINYAQKFTSVIAVLLLLLMVKSFLTKVQKVAVPTGSISQPQLTSGARRGETALEEGITSLEDEIANESKDSQKLKEQVVNFVNEKPDAAAKLVRSWLVES